RYAFFSRIMWWALAFMTACVGGCAVTLGPAVTGVATSPTSTHIGSNFSASLRKPRDYRWIVGIEHMTLGQLHPPSGADQWRVAGFFGYSEAPGSGGSAFGWEGAARVGIFRGPSGDVVPLGGLAG